MTKSARSALIRGLWQARVGVALTMGFIPTARAEIRRETAQITETARNEMQDSILDDETAGVESHLPFDETARVEPRDSDSDSILTAAERRQLRRDEWRRLERLTSPSPE